MKIRKSYYYCWDIMWAWKVFVKSL